MIKEELKQKAEESLDKMVTDKGIILGCHEGFCYDEVTDFMTEFAEPREKQIQIDAEQIRALQKQNGELTDKVKELEQELEKEKNLSQCLSDHNEQLRELIQKMECCGNCYYFNIDKNIGVGNLFCDLRAVKNEYCRNKDHWKFLGR